MSILYFVSNCIVNVCAMCTRCIFGLRCLLIQYGVASKQKRKEKSLKIHYNVNKISGTTSPYSLHQTSSSKWGNIFLTCVFLRRLYNSSMGWKVFSTAHIESRATPFYVGKGNALYPFPISIPTKNFSHLLWFNVGHVYFLWLHNFVRFYMSSMCCHCSQLFCSHFLWSLLIPK